MAQKYDLTDIGNALSRVMDNPTWLRRWPTI